MGRGMFPPLPLFRQVFLSKTLRNCNARGHKFLNYSGNRLKKSKYLCGEQVLQEYFQADGDKDDAACDLDPVLEKMPHPAA